VEHLTLLVGKKSVVLALNCHFGSFKGLARASFQELRQFLPRRQAESVVAALSISVIEETEHARSEQLDNPESIHRACADMKLFNQEVLRVILLDTRYRHISTLEITKGSINESLAHPRDIFRPVIGQSAFAFVLVHTQIPYQIGNSNPARPASAIVGTSGSNVERFAVVKQRRRLHPSAEEARPLALCQLRG
jgi:DNA repair protein RadC